MKKRILSTFTMLCMLLTLLPGGLPAAQAAVTTETEGSRTWFFDDETNVLTISGTGSISDYPKTDTWEPPFRARPVEKVIIESGITHIGNYSFHAFYGFHISELIISDTVISIGVGAFGSDSFSESYLSKVAIPNNVKTIGASAFSYCTALSEVNLSEGLETIGDHAFYNCTALTEITIPKSVTSIDTNALADTGLTQVNYAGTRDEWTALSAYSGLDESVNVVCVDDTYNINFTGDGISMEPKPYKVMSVDQVINLGAEPERTGYKFGGWTSDITEISIDTDANAITLPAFYHEDIALTARWKKNLPTGERPITPTYTPIIFAANNIKPGTVNPSVDVSMFDPSSNGNDCKFSEASEIVKNFAPSASTPFPFTLDSVTRKDDYTITLNLIGTAQTGQYAFGFLPDAFTATTVELNGSELCSLVVDEATVTTPQLTAALKITADDEDPQQIFASTVPFDPAEAAKLEHYTVSYRPTTRAAGDLTVASATVSGADHKTLTLQFNGTAQEGSLDLTFAKEIFAPEPGYTVQNSVQLSANIDPMPYIITFDPGENGTGSMPPMAVAEGETFTFPACTFTPPEGYTFQGWHVDGDARAPFSVGSTYTFTANTLLTAIWQPDTSDPDPEPDPEPTPTPTPTPTPSGSGGGGGKRRNPTQTEDDKKTDTETSTGTVVSVDNILTKDIEENVISGTGESYLQSMVKKEDTFVDWIDRIQVPAYASTLYQTMVKHSDSEDVLKYLIDDSYFTIDPNAGKNQPGGMVYDVTSAETVTHTLSDSLATYGNNPFHTETFTDDSYNVVNVTDGDRSINYAALKEGDAVKTSTFNGIYVTKIRKTGNSNYESARKDACTYAASVYQAFDRDHPEVFWLSGTSKLRILTAKVKYGTQTVEEAYMFFTLADNSGFSLRTPDYQAAGTVAAGIQKRDQLRDAILASLTGTNSYEKVRQLNRWLTEHNEYNTTPDLTTIGNAPHECLSALAGSIGVNGPVCDGYSKAFKVLCDKLGIPCVLADGYAKPRAQDAGEAHMWNYVQMDDKGWYGVDVTWNDPMVKGASGAKSGYENEKFLLVGTNTMIEGLTFGVSHPETNRAANGGVSFINGPRLNGVSFDPSKALINPLLHFTDASADEWYAESVKYVYEKGMMSGTSATTFSPNATTTRGMLISILHRLDGEKSAPSAAFTDVPAGQWYANAVNWAVANGIAGGYGNGKFGAENIITREQMAAILYNFAKYKGYDLSAKGDLTKFTDHTQLGSYADSAMQWANGAGLITGTSATTLAPTGSATRAQAASILMRFCENIAK